MSDAERIRDADSTKVDVGHGYEAELRRVDGELLGVMVTGPKAPACPSSYKGRCGGWAPFKSADAEGWELESEEPLSIRCGCGGQHLFIRGGRAELCDDDAAGIRP